MQEQLHRSRKNKVFGGVAGGIAEYFDIDPVLVRMLFVVLTIAWGVSIIAYILLWIIVPMKPYSENYFFGSNTEEDEPIGFNISTIKNEKRKRFGGIALIAIGGLFMIDNLIVDIDFKNVWPLFIIGIGVYILYGHNKSRLCQHNIHPQD